MGGSRVTRDVFHSPSFSTIYCPHRPSVVVINVHPFPTVQKDVSSRKGKEEPWEGGGRPSWVVKSKGTRRAQWCPCLRSSSFLLHLCLDRGPSPLPSSLQSSFVRSPSILLFSFRRTPCPVRGSYRHPDPFITFHFDPFIFFSLSRPPLPRPRPSGGFRRWLVDVTTPVPLGSRQHRWLKKFFSVFKVWVFKPKIK